MGRLFWLAFTLVMALHLLLVTHFVPLTAVFSAHPLQGDDFDLHIGQVWRVTEGLAGWGQSWVYDVKLLAGQPEGAITDAGSKGWELWTYAGHALGFSKAAAFNSFVLLISALCPLVIFAAARVFGLSASCSLLAAAMASSLWFFDSFVHWAWWVGMISYSGVSYLTLLVLALFFRFLERRSASAALLCGLLLGTAHLIHPYSFFVLALPMFTLYARAFRGLGKAGHAAVAALGLFTLAVNAYWLYAAFLHWHYILDSAYYAQGGLRFLLADFFEVLLTPADTGVIGVRTGFRVLYFGLAIVGLWLWRQKHERRFLPLVVGLSGLLVLAYLGAHVPGVPQVQPYRHILPACFFATLPAAALAEQLWQRRALILEHPLWRAAAAVFVVVLAQHLGTQALYFLPRWIPETERFPDGRRSPISKYGDIALGPTKRHVDYVLPHPAWLEPGFEEVVRAVQRNVKPGERVLVDDGVLGERLAWKTGAEVLGGFRERNVAHAYANFFRRYQHTEVSESALSLYLRTYAVSWVITQDRRADFDRATNLLERSPDIAGRKVYRTTIPVNRVLQGGGVIRARTNRIAVRGSDPKKALVLSYHFHEALRCQPNCKAEREISAIDPVGLIRIPAPHPPDVTIINSYQF